MCFSAVSLSPQNAEALLDRYHDITGLRGELKGSRIGLTERALFFELLHRYEGRAWVSVVRRDRLVGAGEKLPEDIHVYQHLLEKVLEKWQAKSDPAPGQASQEIIIDAGRYDADLLNQLRQEVQQRLGAWGKLGIADSRRCAGIQIADVVANSIYNLAIASNRSARIRTILAPFLRDGMVQVVEFDRL